MKNINGYLSIQFLATATVLLLAVGCGSNTRAVSHEAMGHDAHGDPDHHAEGSSDHAYSGDGTDGDRGHEHSDHANDGHVGHEDPGGGGAVAPNDLLAAETGAYERARPVFEKYCAKCHTSDGAKAKKKTLMHFNMDTYPFGGHHAAEIADAIRGALGADGGEATMPLDNPGVVQGQELAAILAWADAFERSHAGGLHNHQGNQGHRDQHKHGH